MPIENIKVASDVLLTADRGDVTLLLDLSAAFDTGVHDILIYRLQT